MLTLHPHRLSCSLWWLRICLSLPSLCFAALTLVYWQSSTCEHPLSAIQLVFSLFLPLVLLLPTLPALATFDSGCWIRRVLEGVVLLFFSIAGLAVWKAASSVGECSQPSFGRIVFFVAVWVLQTILPLALLCVYGCASFAWRHWRLHITFVQVHPESRPSSSDSEDSAGSSVSESTIEYDAVQL